MKILLAYDGSEWADAALADLKNAGLGAETEVLVLSLADVLLPPANNEVDDSAPTFLSEGMRLALERAEQKLDEASALAKRAAEQIRSDSVVVESRPQHQSRTFGRPDGDAESGRSIHCEGKNAG